MRTIAIHEVLPDPHLSIELRARLGWGSLFARRSIRSAVTVQTTINGSARQANSLHGDRAEQAAENVLATVGTVRTEPAPSVTRGRSGPQHVPLGGAPGAAAGLGTAATEEALALSREVGDRRATAWALTNLGAALVARCGDRY